MFELIFGIIKEEKSHNKKEHEEDFQLIIDKRKAREIYHINKWIRSDVEISFVH
jgi:hypothetical protein